MVQRILLNHYLARTAGMLSGARRGAMMLVATLLFTLTAQTTWADTAVTLQQDGSEYFVNMLSSGTSVLTLSNANITTFKVYDDGGKNSHYAYTGNSFLKITVPAGYVMRITGSAKSEDNQFDYWCIYNGHVYSDGILFNGNPNPASINVQTTGNKTSIYFKKGKSSYSDDSRNLELTVTLVDLTKDITQATVTGIEDLYYYTGAVIPLNYSVIPYNGSTPLTKGTDFTETITKGGVAAEVNEPGDYTLTITGQNPYFGSQTFDFTVWNLMQDWMQDGSDWYVTVPEKHTKILTITAADIAAGKTTFKVYDADGKDGVNSKKDWDGTLVINAPANYLVQLSGTVHIADKTMEQFSVYGTLTVYDNNEASGTTLIDNNTELNFINSINAIIPTVTSSGQNMAIRFESNTWCKKTLDLTVTLLPANNKYGITVPNNITGGSVTSNLNEAKVNDEVTLTVTPDEGYMLNDLTVTDADGAAVSVTDCNWYTDWSNTSSKTATFKMPAKAITVAASFTNILSSDEGGLYVNMPHTGTKNVVIPYNNTSFKLYDDGGKDGNFLKMSEGTLVITAPEGSILNISGKSKLYYQMYYVKSNYAIINGTPDNPGEQMVSDNNTIAEATVTDAISTANTVYVRFSSWASSAYDGYNAYGLDLTVNVTNPNTNYNVNINGSIANGTVTRDKTQAQPNETVNVTATPDEGYVLMDISASDAGGALSMTKPAADGQWGDVVYYTATNGYSFKMRSSDATVNATFMPKTDFYVNMPKTGQRDFTIPAGTTSFKVYDNSGKNGFYFTNDNGSLLLTAPEGYVMNVSGYVKLYYSSDDQDYLDIYDGNSTSATSLGRFKNTSGNSGSQTNTVSATSSNNQMLLHFVTNSYGYVSNGGGVYLTITMWPNVSLANDASNATTLAANHGKVCRVVLADRTLTKNDKWNTLCLPFSLTASEIEASPLAGATIKEMVTTSSLDNNGVLTLNFADAEAITAGKPYIIKWADGGTTISSPVFNGVTIDKTAPAEVSGSNVTFVGQYSPFTIDNNNKNTIIFLSSNNQLGYSKNARELKTFRCHFVVPESVTASEFIFNDGEDMTTGIIEVEDTTGKTGDANAIFDLQGRKIANGQKQTAKGLYIVNGRKVVVK